MPVRIYALAKELKLDSKELVELCKKAGISGKGSALASLDDDEAQRVTQFIQGGAEKKKAAPSATAPLEAVRTPVTPQGGPRHVIRSGRAPLSRPSAQPPSSQPTSRPSAPAPAAPTPAQQAPESPAAEPPSTPPAAPAQPAAASSPPPAPMSAPTPPAASRPIAPGIPIRREDRAGAGGKIRVLGRGARSDRKRADEEGAAKGTKPPSKRREPVINLAALPDTKQPAPPRPAAGEPPAQKPEIRLSKDVIAGHKQGMKAPLDKLVQDEKEKKEPAKVGPGGLSGFTGDKAKGRRGATTTRDEDEAEAKKKGLAGMASARADRAKGRRRTNQRNDIERALTRDDGRKRRTLSRKGTNTAAPRKEQVVLELPCSIRQFSEAAGVPAAQVLRVLMGAGVMANINAQIDQATAELIAAELNLDVQLKAHETLEDELISEIDQIQDAPEDLIPRPPIVTFLGHVDHGKTSLLDYLIGTSVVTGEAGGITQHIRAYQVDKDGRSITFVDTPGHEAFTEMRARGANVTDIAVLVVAADDGIMPQTEEAISHAKAAGVPIVVALNKIDLEGVDANRVMTQLTEHQLTPSEWGGDVEVVPTSAITGVGMNELLETLLTVAELHEYQANPDRPAVGVCLEAEQQGDRGVIAKMVVRNGTLRTGDVLVCGGAHGRVRAMTNTLTGKPVTVAGPSTPVNVTGLDLPPGAGDRFHVLDDITQAREIAASRSYGTRTESLSGVSTKVSFEHFQELLQDGRLGRQDEKVKLNLIIRADARGSLEAIDKELSKLDNPEVELRVLQRSVGGVTLADATLASASDAVIVAFNVIPDEAARNLADERHVEIRRYDVIYKLTDDIRAMIEGRLRPEERVVELGRALVKQVFQISRVGSIAGCYVAQGSIQRGCRIRVNRDGRTIGDYPLDTLRRVKEDVKEVPRGMECGIKLAGFNDIKQDDVLEAYRIEEFARTLA